MSKTGGQAGRTWRLIAIAAVVAFGTWVAGDNHEVPAQSSVTADAAIAGLAATAEKARPHDAATHARPVAPGGEPRSRSATTSRPRRAPGGTVVHRSARQRNRLKVLYLTFDDGPDRTWTPQILAVLDRYDAEATFFQLGRARHAYPKLARRVEAEGHAIANHSTTHRDLTHLANRAIRWEVRNGPDSPCFRPPYGAINQRVRDVLRSEGVRSIILWDIDTLDWTRPGADRIVRTVISRARPGQIVLLHDGGADRAQTVTALDTILRELYAEGYVFRRLNC